MWRISHARLNADYLLALESLIGSPRVVDSTGMVTERRGWQRVCQRSGTGPDRHRPVSSASADDAEVNM